MEKTKKSRGHFPDTEEGQKEYEKQWENDKQLGPIKARKDYSNWTPVSEYPNVLLKPDPELTQYFRNYNERDMLKKLLCYLRYLLNILKRR